MFVCICKGITDKDIKALVTEQGVGSIRELKGHLPLGSQCGTCVKAAQAIIDNTIVDESLFKEVS
ncbi:bacterioferritin-associated ferredoxin [Endozoicomonas sp. G2_1]|uniref:bacterioferritin-associated ferredoxin n=1 Tax=Endozoicomonas sp. G2_1 TaxID=2821091 RepID=UPI001ADA3709|nr:bacterioferritin-associated ferredoxin [Endozoicomonas sp. G2_1]MBO9491698.1 bacterioferritin-associated ferredoxin [Endozoicomonas sp. G2_1]